jgi:hypothetical protein
MWYFIEIIDKKLEESDGSMDDVYIVHAKRYAIRIYSELGKWCDTWWYIHIVYQENCI